MIIPVKQSPGKGIYFTTEKRILKAISLMSFMVGLYQCLPFHLYWKSSRALFIISVCCQPCNLESFLPFYSWTEWVMKIGNAEQWHSVWVKQGCEHGGLGLLHFHLYPGTSWARGLGKIPPRDRKEPWMVCNLSNWIQITVAEISHFYNVAWTTHSEVPHGSTMKSFTSG